MKTIPVTRKKEIPSLSPFQARVENPYEKTVAQLKAKRDELNRLFMNHREQENPDSLSDILDDYFRNSFGRSESGFKLDLIANPYAIIATGSYGRKEVSRKPDVSILFIFKDTLPQGAAGLIREIVYPLWDLGFNINHSTKTMKDCITTAAKDFGTLSSLIDSRFICGVSPLYSRLMSQIREKIVFTRKKEILSFLFDRDLERHLKYSGPEYLMEPDLVYSPGGLKDYHSIMSSTRIALGLIDAREIEYQGLVSTDEFLGLQESLAFIRNVLRFIHLSGDPSGSRLLLRDQHKAARFMHYENDKGRNAVDLFLSDMSKHMDRIRFIRNQFFLGLVPEKTVKSLSSDHDVKTESKWINLHKGMTTFTSSVKLKKHPELLLTVFEESLNCHAPLGPEAMRLVHEFLFSVNESLIDNPEITERFEDLLFMSPSQSGILDSIHETGLLSTFVPIFEKLSHHKEFKVNPNYPLCRHHLLTVTHLKTLIESHRAKVPLLSHRARRILLWAGLLHDIGHALSVKNHEKTAAPEIIKTLSRLHKDEPFIRSVCFLVEHHHLMEHVVSSENLWAKNSYTDFLSDLENPEHLTLLYYLSLANLRARGDGTLYDFIEGDLSLLYETSMGVLAGFSQFPSPALDAYAPDSLEKIKALDPKKKEAPCLHVLEHKNTRTATLSYPLGPKALFGIVSAFLIHNMDIYDLRVIREKGVSNYLVLRVTPPKDRMFEKQKWSELEQTLGDFYSGKPLPDNDLEESLDNHGLVGKPVKIKLYSPTDSLFTRIDIQGRKSVSLLYRFTRAITAMGHTILFLRKGYDKNGNRFLFMVQDSLGKKLSPDKKRQLKAVIEDECNR
ncbi:MAG: HD domain-containing protein [Proteobacteria bacterium]|nr:HD domain-containing protein [Pseudomonadota bacterium]